MNLKTVNQRGGIPVLLPRGERPVVSAADPALSVPWSDLIDAYVHPAKVAIFEALHALGQPLSATELSRMAPGDFDVEDFSYHLRTLEKLGLLVRTHEAPTRGVREKFYFLGSIHPSRSSLPARPISR